MSGRSRGCSGRRSGRSRTRRSSRSAAILANGYRPATSEPGHHQVVIQALPKTIGMAPERVQVLDAYRKARNQSDYRGVPVSDAVAGECAEDARRLLADVRIWFDTRRSTK